MKNKILRMLILTACCYSVFTTNTMEQIPYQDSVAPINPYKNSIAFVERNPGMSEGERTCLNNRLPIVKATLEKMLNRPLSNQQVPKIALIGSGGGYRAMLCTTGSLCAAHKMGLLDATMHITALSGSTWAIAPWISTGMPIKEFRSYLQHCAAKSLGDLTPDEEILILQAITVRATYNQPCTLVDPYGDLLANRLLAHVGDQRQMISLSEQAQTIELGTYPYPIYTAIDGRETIVTGQTRYEFTPHTIGDHTNNTQIPTWAYGRTFEKGQSTNDAPEKPLSYLLGTWGSAFGANIHEMVKAEIHNEILRELLENLPDSVEGTRPLPFWAKVSNYMYHMDDITDATLPTKQYMKFVDAGPEINLPYSPVSGICSERTADILIFLDASAGQIGNELHNVADYAQKYNFLFPAINYDDIDKKTISIFKDENSTTTPVVIYMPRISDQELWRNNKSKPEFAHYNLSGFDLDYETNNGYCKTECFQYTPEHSDLVMNQTEFNMLVNKDAIIREINWVIDKVK